jgi:hypothetical protein
MAIWGYPYSCWPKILIARRICGEGVIYIIPKCYPGCRRVVSIALVSHTSLEANGALMRLRGRHSGFKR